MNNKHLYPVNWKDEIRPDILKRDSWKCQQCNLKHRSRGYYNKQGQFIEADAFIEAFAKKHGFKVQTIHLQIAHIDQNPGNCDYSNLKALCPRCHLNFDRAFNVAKRLRNKTLPRTG